MSNCWSGKSSQTMCLVAKRHLFTPWNVLISLTMAPLGMLRCSILNTFMTCLHAIPYFTSGQLHYDHSDDEAWMVHILGVCLMDATYAMSSPSWHNKTLESGIFCALSIIEATMPSYFLFPTYPKNLHYTLYQQWIRTFPIIWKISQSNLCFVNCSLDNMRIRFMLLWNDSIITLVSYLARGMVRLPTHHIVTLCDMIPSSLID